jgi:hypothetical protein
MQTTAPTLELNEIEKLREEELEEARAIESVMLPAESLRAGAVTIGHQFQPIAAVGGDFLDYFELTDGSIGLYLGDVSGKGLPAAMYAAPGDGNIAGRAQDRAAGAFLFRGARKNPRVSKNIARLWSGRIALTRRITRPTLRSF